MLPNIYEILLIGVIALVLMAVGAGADHHYFVTPLKTQIAQRDGAISQASADAKIEKEKHDAITKDAAAGYAAVASKLAIAISLRQRHPAGVPHESMPAIAVDPGSIPETASEPGRIEPISKISTEAGDGRVSILRDPAFWAGGSILGTCLHTEDNPCSVDREFYYNALNDAAQINGFVDWAKRHGFPVVR